MKRLEAPFDPRPIDAARHGDGGLEPRQLLVQLLQALLPGTNLVAQPGGRPMTLRHEVDQVREFAVDPFPLLRERADLQRRRAMKREEHLVRGRDEVVDHVRGEGGVELFDEPRVEDVLADRPGVGADGRALGHVKRTAIAAVPVDDAPLLTLTGLNRDPRAADVTPDQAGQQVLRVDLGRLAGDIINSVNETVLVIGRGGFIGSHLVEHSLRGDAAVRILDNFVSGSEVNLPFVAAHGTSPRECVALT